MDVAIKGMTTFFIFGLFIGLSQISINGRFKKFPALHINHSMLILIAGTMISLATALYLNLNFSNMAMIINLIAAIILAFYIGNIFVNITHDAIVDDTYDPVEDRSEKYTKMISEKISLSFVISLALFLANLILMIVKLLN